jgi:hypothetical protein
VTRRPSVKPFAARQLTGAGSGLQYNGVIGAIGYETRCQRIPLELAASSPIRVGLAFTDHEELAKSHKETLRGAGYDVIKLKPAELTAWMKQWLIDTADSADLADDVPLRIAIDLSSLSRVRVARLLTALYTHPLNRPVAADLLYTPAIYLGPVAQPDITEVHGPITEWFAGWSSGPNAVVAFLGVGYEEDRALGVVEYLEPGDVWAFVPEGEDSKYDEGVRDMNEWLFAELPEDRLVPYRVDDPFVCLSQMEGLVSDEVAAQRRPVIVPLGPKIFAACALLVALRGQPWPAVWRISPGAYAEPVDCDSNGKLVGISASFSPRPSS